MTTKVCFRVASLDCGLAVLVLLYMYTEIEQLSKLMVDGGTYVSYYWNKRLQRSNGRSLDDQFGNGLHLKTSIRTDI